MTSSILDQDVRPRSSRPARAELDELLAVDLQQIRDFERHAFDRIAGDRRDLVLVGAGGLGRYTLAGLRQIGIEPLAFADNDRRLHGTEVHGLSVLSVEDVVARYGDFATFVVSIWGGDHPPQYPGVSDQLMALAPVPHVPIWILFWKYPDIFLPYYALDLPSKICPQADNIRRAFELMADDVSRREFVDQLRFRMRMDYFNLSPPVEEETYFCHSLYRPADDEVFVDCGAYDGDTLMAFIARHGDRFENYAAIEPDPINFRRLMDCVMGLPSETARQITVSRLAVGERNATIRFDPTGTPSTVVDGGGTTEVECVPLDDMLAGLAPTTIKMDIEGAEPGALRGARRVIAEHSPVLAICVYHAQDHLWSIPNLIHDLNPDYRLYMRPHKFEGWDLVCYAVPPGRLAG